jgi:mannose-6-phosphate isomerase-like protein (cupin superfamily)
MNNPVWSFETLETSRQQSGKPYLEFLRESAMSAGLYTLPVGSTDLQQPPHTEDEVYIVLEGLAQIQIGDQNFPVKTGDTIFVPALKEHRFHSILEELRVIVVFAPAEYGPAGSNGKSA